MGLRIIRFSGAFLLLAGTIGTVLGLVFFFGVWQSPEFSESVKGMITEVFLGLYSLLLVICAMGAWWFVLSEESQNLVEEELDKQNLQLQAEVKERQRTEIALQDLTYQLEMRVEQRTAELSQTVEKLKETQTQLVQTEKMSSLGQLVAGIAHEINNPVNFIHGNLIHAVNYSQDLLLLLDTYQQELPELNEKIEALKEEIEFDFIREDLPKILHSMRVGTDRICQIVLSLRVFSRLDEAEFKPVDIHEGIESTLMILGNRFKAHPERPAIEVIRDYGELPLVECFAGSLNQVFMNVLANAVDAFDDFHPKNSSRIGSHSYWIKIQTRMLAENKVTIAITDNGPGMPELVQAKIFDTFFTTKCVGKGTGLGLSISYEIIVKKHGGNLRCVSKIGAGTTFIIEIPRTQVLQKDPEPSLLSASV